MELCMLVSIHMMLARMGIAYRIVGQEEVHYRGRL